MATVKHMTVQAALQHVSENPVMHTDELTQVAVHELVCRALFEVANSPDAKVRGSMARANKARRLIFDRMVGKRKSGSHPATRTEMVIEFEDLTTGELP